MAYQDEYMPKYRGGSSWDAINGELPDSQYYDANGGVHKKGGWERFQDWTFSPQGFGTMIGGLSAAGGLMGAAGAAGGAGGGAGVTAGLPSLAGIGTVVDPMTGAALGSGAAATAAGVGSGAGGAGHSILGGLGRAVTGGSGGWGNTAALLAGQLGSAALSGLLTPKQAQRQSFAGSGAYSDPTKTLATSNMNLEDIMNALGDYYSQVRPQQGVAPAVPGVGVHDPGLDSPPTTGGFKKVQLRRAK